MDQSKARFWDFLRAFGNRWLNYMSGAPSVPLGILALYVDNPITKTALWLTATFLFVLSAYLVWRTERLQVIALTDRVTPQFKVSFDREKRGVVDARDRSVAHTTMSAYGTPVQHEKETQSKYFRIWIECTSDAIVEKCKAYIVALERRSDGEDAFLHISVPQPLPLQQESFDVHPAIGRAIDFARSDQTGMFDHSPNVYWPFALEGVLNEHATYRFTFRVHGGGVTAPAMCVEVDWRGAWDKIAARQT